MDFHSKKKSLEDNKWKKWKSKSCKNRNNNQSN